MRSLLILLAILSAAMTLGSCKTPMDEDEVPIEEWTVANVDYNIYSSRNPTVVIMFLGLNKIHNYSYFLDFELTQPLDFKGLISISGEPLS